MSEQDATQEARRISRRGALGGLAAGIAIPASAGCISIRRERASETVTKTVDAEGIETVSVSNPDGDVKLTKSYEETVTIQALKQIRGEFGLGDISLDATQTGTHLSITAERSDQELFGSGWIDLTLNIPESVRVQQVSIDDGDAIVEDVGGDPRLHVTDGDVRARRAHGDLNIDIVDGDISVRETDGAVSADIQDGDIDIRNPKRLGDIRAVDGDVYADAPTISGHTRVQTTDGDVVLRIGPELDARIEIQTQDGDVTGTRVFDDVQTRTETYLEGIVGDGTNLLTVSVTDGDISIRK